MKLGRIFQNGMILQREKPFRIWGEAEQEQTITVSLNGEIIAEETVVKGAISILIPPQKAQTDAVLQIGDQTFTGVDIGEVWIAGGQSNMEFPLKYDCDGEKEIARADDPHFRFYQVGQYAFLGEREEQFKDDAAFDKWLPYEPKHASGFSAVAVYFAKELRKLGVPVGIIGCYWGGTSAAAWTDREALLEDADLRQYVDEYEAGLKELDLDLYEAITKSRRWSTAKLDREGKNPISILLEKTMKPQELAEFMGTLMSGKLPDEKEQEFAGMPKLPQGVSQEDFIRISMAVGPKSEARPSGLYESMLLEIVPYTVKGVIWYQGEADCPKADIYEKLFTCMITCWRELWQEELPFLLVQLPTFGAWMAESGEGFVQIREAQEKVTQSVPSAYMASISDVGNVYDMHPKEKREVGKRLAFLAKKHMYGEAVEADAPEYDSLERDGAKLTLRFRHGDGLWIKEKDFSFYNGFDMKEIPGNLLPPILGGVNGLRILADGEEVKDAICMTKENCLIVKNEILENAMEIHVEFAKTGFYEVNLYNDTGVPAKPFIAEWNDNA